MKNKLGMNNIELERVEKKIVQTKLELLDEYFTFNKQQLDLDYLVSLHYFLFCDFYYDEFLGLRYLNNKERKLVNKCLEKIDKICISDNKDIDKILELIRLIWELQPFIDGNTRTLLAYLKIINSAFLLNLNIDINKHIESNQGLFRKENFVNQKQLTKK